MNARGHGLTIVKLGGSHAFSPHLTAWLDAIATCAGRVVVVPGGGPFADAVRAAQPRIGFDDRAAHRMGLLAMEQYACALASLRATMRLAGSAAAIRSVLHEGRVPVWCPVPMALRAPEVPWSWDVTSDSLAAWLAGKLAARQVLLVKQVEPWNDPVPAQALVERGIVDPLFPGFLAASGAAGYLAGPGDHGNAAAGIRNGSLSAARIDLHECRELARHG